MLDDIKKTLWAAADKLRANMDAAEYKHLVLGLIFLKYVSDTFTARQAEVLVRLQNPDDEFHYPDATPEDLAAELEDRDYYKSANVFWVPEGARWETLRSLAKSPEIGKFIDNALTIIEGENPRLKGILDKRYARAQLPDGKLGELVDLISTIGFGENPAVARDVLGQVYEYFLGMFASAEGKRGGQFYTPASIVKTLVAVLAPHQGAGGHHPRTAWITERAMGAASPFPEISSAPDCSTTTATATSGDCAGAKATNQATDGRSFPVWAVPVFPATRSPGIRALLPVPRSTVSTIISVRAVASRELIASAKTSGLVVFRMARSGPRTSWTR